MKCCWGPFASCVTEVCILMIVFHGEESLSWRFYPLTIRWSMCRRGVTQLKTSWHAWHVLGPRLSGMLRYIYVYIYIHQYHAKQLDEVGAGHNRDWLYEHLELANDGHYYIYIYTMYILGLYLFNIFGLCIYKIRARGNCIDTHSLLSFLAIRLSGY